MKKKGLAHKILFLGAVPLFLLSVFPMIFTLVCSLMPGGLDFTENGAAAGRVSLQGYYEAFIASPQYLLRFWASLFAGGITTLFTLLVSSMAGFSFAKYRFPGKRLCYGAMLLFMLLPLQVTLLPNYIVLDALGMLNTYASFIVPAMFMPFGTFLLTFTYKKIPDDVIEAARMDGAGTVRTLVSVATPVGKVGAASLAVLTFVDSWNMVEQPMVFLQSVQDYPISVYLAGESAPSPALFACGVLCIIPALLLLWFFKNELAQGIDISGTRA